MSNSLNHQDSEMIFESPQRAWGERWIPISILGGSGESKDQIKNWCSKVYPVDTE